MTEPVEAVTGACLCGDVTYRLSGPLRPVVFCHCKQCQRQSGLYYAATATEKDACQINDAAGNLAWYRSSEQAERGFCRRCGSSLFWRHDDENHISILAGSLDDTAQLVAGRHIFVDDKGSYYRLPEGAVQS